VPCRLERATRFLGGGDARRVDRHIERGCRGVPDAQKRWRVTHQKTATKGQRVHSRGVWTARAGGGISRPLEFPIREDQPSDLLDPCCDPVTPTVTPGPTVVAPAASAPETRAAQRWVNESWESVHPWASGRVFQNFADPDLDGWETAYYGPNYARLTQIKRRYDPDELLRFPQSVPAASP
jgi:hypothetical protein